MFIVFVYVVFIFVQYIDVVFGVMGNGNVYFFDVFEKQMDVVFIVV